MKHEDLLEAQAELRARNSSPEGRRRTHVAVRSLKEGQARLTIKQALAQARRLKRDKRRWKKNYVALKRDKRKWMSLLREDARALHTAALALHKEMTEATALLRHARAQHSALTVDAQRAKDIATGYRLGLERKTQEGLAHAITNGN